MYLRPSEKKPGRIFAFFGAFTSTEPYMALVTGAITHFVPYAIILVPVASVAGWTTYAYQAAQCSDTAEKADMSMLF